MLIVANFHYVRPSYDEPFPGIHGITPAELEAQLRVLAAAGTFVDAEQVRDAVRGVASLPRTALLVTFDDGLREQFDHALPVLDRLGVPALFLVNSEPLARTRVAAVHQIHLLRARLAPSDFIALLGAEARAQGLELPAAPDPAAAAAQYRYDTPAVARLKYLLNYELPPAARDRLVSACFASVVGEEAAVSRRLYMDVDQVRRLAERGWLGSHGDGHLPLGRLARAAIRHDLATSLERLERWTGRRVYALSYPYGSHEACGGPAGAVAAELGFELGFTMERAANADLDRPHYLARFDCSDLPGGTRAFCSAEELFERAPVARWYRGSGDRTWAHPLA